MVSTEVYEIVGTARSLDLSKPDIFMCSLYLFVGILTRLAKRQLPSNANRSL